jgi:YVTN family beta-propeller protein
LIYIKGIASTKRQERVRANKGEDAMTLTVGASAPPSTRSASSTRKLRPVLRVLLLVWAAGSAAVLGSTETLAQNAYITNAASNTVSVIDTAKNAVIATIPVGSYPEPVGVSSDGSRIYVGSCDGTLSVINGSTNSVIATVPIGGACPGGIAVSPDGNSVYVTNGGNGTMSIIDATRSPPQSQYSPTRLRWQ